MMLNVISTQPSWNGIPPPTFLWGVFISASGFGTIGFGGKNTQIDIFFSSKLIVNLIKVSSSLKNSVALVPFFFFCMEELYILSYKSGICLLKDKPLATSTHLSGNLPVGEF